MIAFGFIKCLGWTPRRVAADVSDRQLDQSEDQLERGHVEQSLLLDEQVRPAFALLRDRLRMPFREAVSDPKTLSTYVALLERIVGDTRLRDYYTREDAATDLTQWWYAVQRRVRGEVQRRTDGALFALASARAARKAAPASILTEGSISAGR